MGSRGRRGYIRTYTTDGARDTETIEDRFASSGPITSASLPFQGARSSGRCARLIPPAPGACRGVADDDDSDRRCALPVSVLGARDHKQPPLLGTMSSPPRSEQEPGAQRRSSEHPGAGCLVGACADLESGVWMDAPLCSAQVCPQLVHALALSRSVFEIEFSSAPPLRRTALCSLPLLPIV